MTEDTEIGMPISKANLTQRAWVYMGPVWVFVWLMLDNTDIINFFSFIDLFVTR